MAKTPTHRSGSKKSVEALTHEEAKHKNIPHGGIPVRLTKDRTRYLVPLCEKPDRPDELDKPDPEEKPTKPVSRVSRQSRSSHPLPHRPDKSPSALNSTFII